MEIHTTLEKASLHALSLHLVAPSLQSRHKHMEGEALKDLQAPELVITATCSCGYWD